MTSPKEDPHTEEEIAMSLAKWASVYKAKSQRTANGELQAKEWLVESRLAKFAAAEAMQVNPEILAAC